MATKQKQPVNPSSTLTLVPDDGGDYGNAEKFTQYTAALAVTLGALACGTVLAWTSSAQKPVEAGDLGFPVTSDEFGWAGALMPLGAATICYPIAIIMNLIGRKITMLGLIIPFTIGWALIYWASNIAMLLIGRYLVGLAGGAFCVSAPLYTSEIASQEIRGTLGTYFQLMVTVGILFVNVIGYLIEEIAWVTLICALVPFVFGIVFFFQPETPVYYIKKGDLSAARNSLRHFRGKDNSSYNIDQEMRDLISVNQGPAPTLSDMRDELGSRSAKKAVLISFGLMFFQQLSGVNAVIFYASDIFEEADVGIEASICVIIVMAIQVVATFAGSIIIEKLGRRILLLASDLMMAVSALGLGIYFSLQKSWSEDEVKSIAWLPILALSVFIIMYSVGYGPIPWMMVGEITPDAIKGALISVACTFNWLLAFLVTKFFGTISADDALGKANTFYLFTAVSAVGTVFVFCLVPETKGKSTQQIQEELNVTLGALATGTVLAWTSPAENPIKNGKLGFPVTDEQYGWVGALMTLGAATICFPISIIMNIIGRKFTMLSLIIPFTIGWAFIYFASGVIMLYIGRFLVGLAGGAFCVSAPLYNSEIASKEIRGTLGTYFQLMITIGILFVNVIGDFLSIQWITLVCLIVPFVFGVIFMFQPETPVFLVKQGKLSEAKVSLAYFRGKNNVSYNLDKELQGLVEENQKLEAMSISFRAFTTKAAAKAISISLGLMFFQQLSGVNAVIFYAGGIFDQADVGIESSKCVIIVMAVQVIATFVGSLWIEKLGRKLLLLSSALVMAVSSLALGIYFHLQESWTSEELKSIAWLPVLALSLFIIMFSVGFGPIPWMMAGELNPKEIKSVVISAACTFNWLLAFLVTKFFGTVSSPNVLGQANTFYVFTAVSAVGTIFVFLLVPETKGKTLQEIQDELNGVSKRENVRGLDNFAFSN